MESNSKEIIKNNRSFERLKQKHASELDEPGCLDDIQNTDHGKGSKVVTAINLFKNIIGIGILTLPYAFSWAGWVGGSLVLVIVGYLSVYCCWILMGLANQEQDRVAKLGGNFDPRNYQEFIEAMFKSRKWTYAVNLLIFGGQLSDLIASCMFFTLYFQESFCYWEMENFCSSRLPALIISLCIIFPLSFIRQLKSFKTYSLYGLIIILISIVFILSHGFIHIKSFPIQWEELAVFNYESFPLSIGIYAAAYETFAVYFDLRHSMQEPKEFPKVYLNVTHCVNFLYVGIGAGGYILFGSQTKDIILFNLPMANYIFVFIVFLYCVQLAITYSMHLFPLIVIAEMALEDRDPYGEYEILGDQEQIEDLKDNSLDQKLQQQQDENQNEQQDDNDNQDQQQNNNDTSQPSQIHHHHHRHKHNETVTHQILTSVLDLNSSQLSAVDRSLEWHSVFIRIGYTAFIFTVTLLFKQVSLFFGFFGAACGIPMMFIVPLVIWELKAEEKPMFYRVINFIIVGLATFNMVVGMYQSGLEIYDNFQLSQLF